MSHPGEFSKGRGLGSEIFSGRSEESQHGPTALEMPYFYQVYLFKLTLRKLSLAKRDDAGNNLTILLNLVGNLHFGISI